MIRTVVVDDEAPARAKVRRFLSAESDVELAGEAADGPAAVSLVRSEQPDLVFLDVRMPGADGFEVLEAIADTGPHVIFVTAHAEHAVRAFDVGAADYLLKPFDRERFRRALDRAREHLGGPGGRPPAAMLRELVRRLRESVTEAEEPLHRILVRERDRGRSFFVPVEQIDWLEADGNYVRLHTRDRRGADTEPHLVRATLASLEERLDSGRFARIGRGAIVNLDRIRVLHDWSHGDRLVVLEDGTELKLSRRYRDRLEEET